MSPGQPHKHTPLPDLDEINDGHAGDHAYIRALAFAMVSMHAIEKSTDS
jgi:hypothetical protein